MDRTIFTFDEQMNTRFDTHSIIKRLVTAGLEEPIAEEIVRAIDDKRDHDSASKLDLMEVENRLSAEIAKTNIAIERTKNEILKWMIPFMFTNTLAIIGVIISLLIKH